MRKLRCSWLTLICMLLFVSISYGHKPPKNGKPQQNNNQTGVSFRDDCTSAQAQQQIDQDINNVRARLLVGGDVWWDGDGEGRYIVPKVEPGSDLKETSSIFAGAVWIGGFDGGDNLRVAAQTYGSSNGDTDFWPGPLSDVGEVVDTTCENWDRFYEVLGDSIRVHIARHKSAIEAGEVYSENMIPPSVKYWPAQGNPYFFEKYGFELPNATQGLASFHDNNQSGTYEPQNGDYPRIEIRGCEAPQYPDQMIFWIYNDAGGAHTESQGKPIRMEIQVQAFGYETSDEINNMTFQRYKLINRANDFIDSTFFAMWVDPDLGCYDDDFIGCDTTRSLAYVYNEDALDGQSGCNCEGVNTYCNNIPILGIDYFRGPTAPKIFCNTGLCNPLPGELADTIVELPMSSFTYFNNLGHCNPPEGTTDPESAVEFYRYLSGTWADGTPFTYGGDGYSGGGDPVNYAFTDPPNLSNGWSMCSADLPCGDRRTVQASGPFRLDPGAINELIIGVVWVPDLAYPCPDITPLLFADDVAQALFDNCFEIVDGPDAPDMDIIELDRELVILLSNDTLIQNSNNAFEQYTGKDLKAPEFLTDPLTNLPVENTDTLYRFEGYQIYQLRNEQSSIDDPENAIQIAQFDIRNNGVGTIVNWVNPDEETNLDEVFFEPQAKVESEDNADLKHSFVVTHDEFATGDRRLINHKRYFFTVIAYAYNQYLPYDPGDLTGQRTPYLPSRLNIKTYAGIPRRNTNKTLNAKYGDGVVITRVEGAGVGDNFLDMTDEMRETICKEYPNFNGEVTYLEGEGPLDITIFNPLAVQDGEYRLTIKDSTPEDDDFDTSTANWLLVNTTSGETVASESTIELLNEHLVKDFGISVAIGQTIDAGDDPFTPFGNGALGVEVQMMDGGEPYMEFVQHGENPVADFVNTDPGEIWEDLDYVDALVQNGNGEFVPFTFAEYDNPTVIDPYYLTPGWTIIDGAFQKIVHAENPIHELNNVDIVFTSNKDLWTRCVVVESANVMHFDPAVGLGLETLKDPALASSNGIEDQNIKHLDLRGTASVGKDGKPDNEIDEDGRRKMGMGWFPGYAVDVEKGIRLNIFFGENSVYNADFGNLYEVDPSVYNNNDLITDDLLFNPNNQIVIGDFFENSFFSDNVKGATLMSAFAGGQHWIYVTDEPYDEGELLYKKLHPKQASPLKKVASLVNVKWAGLPVLAPGESLNSVEEGIIPRDFVVKVRVSNPYQICEPVDENEEPIGTEFGYPTYKFKIEGKECVSGNSAEDIATLLDNINVVPNPYYGFSEYERGTFENIVKITNLPPKCTISIYSLDGKFIRRYQRNEVGINQDKRNSAPVAESQVIPNLEWDLKNGKGIPVSSGVYLINIEVPGVGAKTLKWFGIGRKFDPSSL